MPGKKPRKRRRLMPGEVWLKGVDRKELWEARGGILYDRLTPGVRSWLRLLATPGLPRIGGNEVVCLSSRRNSFSLSIGLCRPLSARGRNLWVILLDDLDRRFVARVNATIRRHVPGVFARRYLRRFWDAYLLQTYLHELGHARYDRRGGARAGRERHEQEAERFAWRRLSRLLPRRVVLGALAMNWVLEVTA